MTKSMIYFLLTLNFVFTLPAQSEEKIIRLWVASSAKAGIFAKIKVPFEKKTGIKLDYPEDTTTSNSNQYMVDVINGKVEAALTSLGIEEWTANVKKDGTDVPKTLTSRVIGNDVINTFIHPQLKIKSLTLEQLADLTTGKVKNWSEIGGAKQEVILVIAPNKTATNSSFQKIVLKGKDFSGKIFDKVDSFETLLETVAKTPGAIGWVPGSFKSNLAQLVQTPPVGRPITLINLGKPSENLRALIEFLNVDAKKIMADSKK